MPNTVLRRMAWVLVSLVVMGPAAAAQDKPSEQTKRSRGVVTAAAVKPRRPSESLEADNLPEDAYRGRGAQGAPPQPAPVPPVTQNFDFEE